MTPDKTSEDQPLSSQQTNHTDNAADKKTEIKFEGSGIFTVDGKELPKIDGGYEISNPGGSLGDNEFE